MIRPISPFLAEFRPVRSIDAMLRPPLMPAGGYAPKPDEQDARDDLDAQIDAAARAGIEEVRREAKETLQAALAKAAADHETRLAAERQRWVESEGLILAAALAEGLAALEDRLAHSLNDVLAPLLPRLATAKAIDCVRGAIATLLADDADRPIRISGPADLIGAIQSACAGQIGVGFVESDAADVTIEAGDSRIHSRTALWAATLESALGDKP